LPRILVCDPLHEDGLALLQQSAHVDVVEGPGLTVHELEERIGSYHAVINRSRTPIPESVIRRGVHLRVIARAGAGLDNINADVAREMGIQVINAPDANTIAVAEHAFALMLGLARHIPQADQSMKAGRWEKSALVGTELAGKTLGIIGFGRIGRQVAMRAKAFDMHILVNQNRLTPELAQEWRIENVDLLDLLTASDFISIHVPMRPANVGLIGAEELAHMRPTAYLINTARGGIVDEEALLQALNAGRIAGAGLDVFQEEPRVRPELAGHPRVLATPHLGASTDDAQRKVAVDIAEQVLHLLRNPGPAQALSLRIVPVAQVLPHEACHDSRVQRLATRITADQRLLNPPVVAEVDGEASYVVLDGATRVCAFKLLAHPHIVVQVVDVERDNVQLFAWNHVVRDRHAQGGVEGFMDLVRTIDGLHLRDVPPDQVPEAVRKRGALGYILTMQNRAYLLEIDESALESADDWLDVLNKLVDGYGQWGDVERVLTADTEQVRSLHSDAVALVAFPTFTPDIVLQMAAQGRLLPAGITRFVIPGRILHLNAPLDKLISDEPLSLKQDWLDRFVQEKLGERRVRYYEEPVMLLDE
jgi:phosphoglycerate dehydrogenase-like enzyme